MSKTLSGLLELRKLIVEATTFTEVLLDEQATETPLTIRELTDLALMRDSLNAYAKMVDKIRTKARKVVKS